MTNLWPSSWPNAHFATSFKAKYPYAESVTVAVASIGEKYLHTILSNVAYSGI